MKDLDLNLADAEIDKRPIISACSACKFWQALVRASGEAPREGQCRLGAPHPAAGGPPQRAYWPLTWPLDWCGGGEAGDQREPIIDDTSATTEQPQQRGAAHTANSKPWAT
jgi:hypothetical protein